MSLIMTDVKAAFSHKKYTKMCKLGNLSNLCTILLFMCLKTNAQDDNLAYMKREHSLIKPYQGKCFTQSYYS